LEDAEIRKERKKAEENLIVNEKLYHSLFDQANEGFVLRTIDGEVCEVNKAYAEMHGYTVDEVLRMDKKEFNSLNVNVSEDYIDTFRRRNEGEVVRFEVMHYHKDGSVFPVSVSASLIDAGARYYLEFYQDITERKEAEAAVRKKIEDLEWFNSISVGRELKMVDLKKEINELSKRLGEEPRYEIYK
jgi:PAS domain S-box-containing protein